MIETLLAKWNYIAVIVLMMVGLYIVMERQNLIKKIIGLMIFQTSVFLFYISIAKIENGTAPIIIPYTDGIAYSNPLPHVLILTAIVVGVATVALGLALVLRINDAFGSIEEDIILKAKREDYKKARRGLAEDGTAQKTKSGEGK